ncbi:MAG TPA: hypothetical protein VF337_06240 [Candidatus Limnocylindrales bacterium]
MSGSEARETFEAPPKRAPCRIVAFDHSRVTVYGECEVTAYDEADVTVVATPALTPPQRSKPPR